MCHREPRQKLNEAKRAASKNKEALSQTCESAHLLEPTLRVEDADFKKPKELKDPLNRIKIAKWELRMREYCDNKKSMLEGFFAL